jgi:hypothetical protein
VGQGRSVAGVHGGSVRRRRYAELNSDFTVRFHLSANLSAMVPHLMICKKSGWHESNIGFRERLALLFDKTPGGVKMELAIVTILVLVAASQIPGDIHVVYFR